MSAAFVRENLGLAGYFAWRLHQRSAAISRLEYDDAYQEAAASAPRGGAGGAGGSRRRAEPMMEFRYAAPADVGIVASLTQSPDVIEVCFYPELSVRLTRAQARELVREVRGALEFPGEGAMGDG